jgi:hypothetical protein
MKILATIIGVLLTDIAIIVFVSMRSTDSPVPAMIGVAVLGGALLSVALTNVATHWSGRRIVAVSAGAWPLLVWIVAFGLDVGGATYMRWFRPGQPYMLGFSIMLFIPCWMAAGLGLVGATVARSLLGRKTTF